MYRAKWDEFLSTWPTCNELRMHLLCCESRTGSLYDCNINLMTACCLDFAWFLTYLCFVSRCSIWYRIRETTTCSMTYSGWTMPEEFDARGTWNHYWKLKREWWKVWDYSKTVWVGFRFGTLSFVSGGLLSVFILINGAICYFVWDDSFCFRALNHDSVRVKQKIFWNTVLFWNPFSCGKVWESNYSFAFWSYKSKLLILKAKKQWGWPLFLNNNWYYWVTKGSYHSSSSKPNSRNSSGTWSWGPVCDPFPWLFWSLELEVPASWFLIGRNLPLNIPLSIPPMDLTGWLILSFNMKIMEYSESCQTNVRMIVAERSTWVILFCFFTFLMSLAISSILSSNCLWPSLFPLDGEESADSSSFSSSSPVMTSSFPLGFGDSN